MHIQEGCCSTTDHFFVDGPILRLDRHGGCQQALGHTFLFHACAGVWRSYCITHSFFLAGLEIRSTWSADVRDLSVSRVFPSVPFVSSRRSSSFLSAIRPPTHLCATCAADGSEHGESRCDAQHLARVCETLPPSNWTYEMLLTPCTTSQHEEEIHQPWREQKERDLVEHDACT